jgi:TDG/mug DNA glycosylase family protein
VPRLEKTVAEWRPRSVAVLGVTAYRTAFGRPKAKVGRQPETLDGVPLWVLPNPSGLNAHYQQAALTAEYAALRESLTF